MLLQEPRLFEALEAVGQNVGRNALGSLDQLAIQPFSQKQEIPNYKQCPLVADQVERTRDGTFGSS